MWFLRYLNLQCKVFYIVSKRADKWFPMNGMMICIKKEFKLIPNRFFFLISVSNKVPEKAIKTQEEGKTTNS